MLPVRTANTNHSFGPPIGVTDGSIGDLPCEIRDDADGRWIRSVWQLSDEERAAIAAGATIELDVAWIGGFPPVALNISDECPLADAAA